MDIRKIKKLIELVEESGISELEITEGEESVRIHRSGQPAAQVQYSALFNKLRPWQRLQSLNQHQQPLLKPVVTVLNLQWSALSTVHLLQVQNHLLK